VQEIGASVQIHSPGSASTHTVVHLAAEKALFVFCS